MGELSGIPTWFLAIVGLSFGLAIGSFLNVVIHRLPRDESIVRPGSRCPGCGTAVAPWDNVPVLSYLWLRGRCRHCRTRISLRYPAVELLTGVVFAAIVVRYGVSPLTPVWCVFAAALIAAAAIDFDHRIIPDEISLGGLAFFALLMPAANALTGASVREALTHTLLGALLGAGVLWIVGFTHARLCVALGREFEHWPGEGESLPTPGSVDYWVWFPGVGFGDVKLLAMVGAALGPIGVLETIFAAAVAGLVLGVVWALVTRRWNAPFGFGPAIAAGALLVLLAPPNLLRLF